MPAYTVTILVPHHVVIEAPDLVTAGMVAKGLAAREHDAKVLGVRQVESTTPQPPKLETA